MTKQNKALLSELVRTDFKLRYQGSVLGYAWSLLKPLLIFVILYVVFVRFLKLGDGVPHYPIYLLLGIVLWNFFAEMTQQSLGSIVGRGDLIRKIRIPRWIIVLSSSISAVINLLLNLVVVAVFMVINHVDVRFTIVILPLILIEVYLFALGISLFLSALYVKFRDIGYIWEVFLQAGFYLTPILYPLARITNLSFQKLIMINPMGQAIQDARYAVVTDQTITAHRLFNGGPYTLIPFAIILVLLVGGLAFFRKESKYFAENI
ncbi:MAG: Transport permease protein [Candidatus Saccharibacteria bacterium]|jgi:ABC-2 type transport system permease protein|nr:Transport permease protein [Candidatus Saccharibacteria bacterium]